MRDLKIIERKYTEELRRHLQLAGGRPLEVIVRVKVNLLDAVVDFVRDLERQGLEVRLLDKSQWTNSILVRATPAIVSKLAERDEVDRVDLNSEIQLQGTTRNGVQRIALPVGGAAKSVT